MKQDWHPDELAQHWTLDPGERALLANKTGTTRLAFAVLLKAFALDGRFPRRGEDVPLSCVAFVAHQVELPPEVYLGADWSERTLRYHKAQIRAHFGFRGCSVVDGEQLVAWLGKRVTHLDPASEGLRQLAFARLRELHLEPPTPERLSRLLRSAVATFEEKLYATVSARLSPVTREALDALISTDGDET